MQRVLTGKIKKTTLTLMRILSLMAMAATANAMQVTDLYQSQVTAAGKTPAQQRQAMSDALKNVVVKVSGRSDLEPSQLTGLLKKTEQYVQSYAFEGGGRGQPLYMRVSFDSMAVNGAMREAGLPVWSSNRPKVLLWMVIEENGQRRIVSQDLDPALVDQVAKAGIKRGLPINLPLNDVQDIESVSAADIWGGFMENIKAASARYHPDITLVAKVHKAGLLWQGDWQIIAVGGTQAQEFTGPDAASVIAPGVEWVTNDIAAVYSAKGPVVTGAPAGQPLTLKITQVDTLAEYAALMAYLKKLVVVRETVTKEVSGDTLVLQVATDTQVVTVLQTLKADAKLVQTNTAVNPTVPAPAEAVPAEVVSETQPGAAPVNPDPATTAPLDDGKNTLEFEWHG